MLNVGNTKIKKVIPALGLLALRICGLYLYPDNWLHPWVSLNLPQLNNLAVSLPPSSSRKCQIQWVTKAQGSSLVVESCLWGDNAPFLPGCLGNGEGSEAQKQSGPKAVLHSHGWNLKQTQGSDKGHPSIFSTSYATQGGQRSKKKMKGPLR